MSKQTLNDRLLAAKHALARDGLARAVCKATTEELYEPKSKHLDYLVQWSNDPNANILKLGNLLIKRTQHTSWVVVFKALITVHHLMCYGEERFIQYLAYCTHIYCNELFLAYKFLDKVGDQSCDMSKLIKRYANYVNEKAVSYRTVGFDFCKCKREDGDDILRQMDTGKLLKTLPVLQNQVDALLEFECSTNDLCSKVVNACFVLLFKDLIGLSAGYNHGLRCLLERYEEEESKERARKGLDIYKEFLIRLDKIIEFFELAKDSARIHPYGEIDKDDIPELSKMPNSILEAMEQHIASLEGKMGSASAAAGPSEMQLESTSSPTEASKVLLAKLLKQWGKPGRKQAVNEDREDEDSSSSEDEEDDDSSSSEDDDDLSTTLKNSPQNQEISKVDFIAKALTDIDMEELTLFSYKDLQNASKNFLDKTIEKGGYKIGEGGFGTVYKVVMADRIVAVKRLKDPVDEQFITELKILTRYRHENLLPLLGCSVDGPTCCLVYEYMANGSLEDRLACIGKSKPLSWKTRLSIAYGSALGINHMHTYRETPMVHRDIKSANILLDENFVPKVGDFGLVRISSSGNSTVMAMTSNVIGTSVYMAREAFYGDVSIKLDTYSFGVVLLELLTGLPPFDVEREYRDLVTYMEGCDNILTKLDPQTDWCSMAAKELYTISKQCLLESKKARPAISQILGDLKKCLSHAGQDDTGQQTSEMGIFAKVLSLIPM